MPGVTFAQLPEEESPFPDYLQKTEAVWARAVKDTPDRPAYDPLPVAEFLTRFADRIAAYHVVDVYLGFRDDICHPAVSRHEVTEGGTLVPLLQNGRVVEGAHTIVGGTNVVRDFIDPVASCFVRYHRGLFRAEDELAMSNLGYSSAGYRGGQRVSKPDAFLRWANNVLAWMRRNTPESVPVHTCNYKARATAGAARASRQGLKIR
ncbi:MAG TPA: hypothetical protein VH092_11325 [Urbifossiella sp.]|nr:hypothetical protein [Urbifossiella sp.]